MPKPLKAAIYELAATLYLLSCGATRITGEVCFNKKISGLITRRIENKGTF